MHARVKTLKPHANTPAAAKMNDINPKYENTRKMHRLENSSKHPIVFNNCQVTNNKKIIFLKTTNKRYYLFSQCSK
jgi:hypothetical protein